MYYGSASNVAIFDFEEREYVATNIAINSGTFPEHQYIPGHIFGQYVSNGSYASYFFKYQNGTLVNDINNVKALTSMMSQNGLITDVNTSSLFWARSNITKKFFTSTKDKPIPYFEVRQNTYSDIWLTKFDRNNNTILNRKVLALPITDAQSNSYLKPDDIFIGNTTNGNQFYQIYVLKNSNNVRQIHIYKVTLNISI